MKKTIDLMSKTGKWLLVFGIVFSQLAFPLGVLADEVKENLDEENTYVDATLDDEIILDNESNLDNEEVEVENNIEENTIDVVPEEGEEVAEEPKDEPVISENIITINGEETDTYVINLGDSTSVSIAVDGEEVANFDFSTRLYGTYQYTIEGIEKTVTINYIGNNAEILKKYEMGLDLSKKIRYDDSNCVIAGYGKNNITVADIINYYDLEKLMTDYNATINITRNSVALDSVENVVANDKLEIVTNNDVVSELVRTDEFDSYSINRLGDINADNNIDVKDQELVLDNIRKNTGVNIFNDINGDGILDILDATDSLFIINDSAIENVTDILKSTVVVDDNEAVIGEEVKVSLKISGFTNTSLYGIEGLINYDDSILELVGATINGTNSLGSLSLENNRFAYSFEAFNNNEEALLVLTFKVIASGNVDVTISNLVASYGNRYNLENDTTTVSLNVLDYGKGGDVEENVTPTNPVNTENVTDAVVQVVNTVKANNNDSNDTYEDEKKAKDENKTVKKEKKKDADEEDEEKGSASKTIIIILIILVIIGLIYVIFKDDEEEVVEKPEIKGKKTANSSKKNNKK